MRTVQWQLLTLWPLCSAENMKAAAADNGPPRGIADPKFRNSATTEGSKFEAAADVGRARSAVASSRGNEPGARLACDRILAEE